MSDKVEEAKDKRAEGESAMQGEELESLLQQWLGLARKGEVDSLKSLVGKHLFLLDAVDPDTKAREPSLHKFLFFIWML